MIFNPLTRPGTGRVTLWPFRNAGLAVCLSLIPGTMTIAEEAAPIDADRIYKEVCRICHQAGLNAAPKYGNKILWGKVVQKGRDVVYQNSINGFRAMPPRGGRTTLTDEEVIAAVDYMVEGSGGWAE
jgi:cytochrome c5